MGKRHEYIKDTQMSNKHKQRCLASLIIGETLVKTTMRYHLTPMTAILKTDKKCCWGGREIGLLIRHKGKAPIGNILAVP